MVDGASIPLTEQEQADHDAMAVAWAAGASDRAVQAALPDLATQVANLTALLINSGTVEAADLPAAQITAVNAKLTEMSLPTIAEEKTQILGGLKVK